MRNNLMPEPCIIKKIKEESPKVKTFTLSFKDSSAQKNFSFLPGQFVELSVFGVGEAPISISSPPSQKNSFDLSVMKAGKVTDELFELKEGATVGVRGPYGNSWPLEELNGKNVYLIAGGIGVAPIHSLLLHLLENPSLCKKITLYYGSKSPKEIIYRELMNKLQKNSSINTLLAVDCKDEDYKCHVGLVTDLLKPETINPENAVALICGPSVMIHFVSLKLKELGFSEERIYASLERLMYCGTGKCGHCMIGEKHVCLDGPVFPLNKINLFQEEE
ncbi:MAG: FAD/NAD(P)-binding protein [archaeon]